MKLIVNYNFNIWALPIAFGYEKHTHKTTQTIEHSIGIILLCILFEFEFETKLKTKLK